MFIRYLCALGAAVLVIAIGGMTLGPYMTGEGVMSGVVTVGVFAAAALAARAVITWK